MSEVTAVPLRPVGKSGVAALWIGVAVLIAVGIGGAYAATQKAVLTALPAPEFLAANAKRHGVKTTPSGLEYIVIKPGAGPTPTANDVALVDYRGTLTNGTEFDASKPGQPVAMPLSRVVPGFAEALMLMPKGAVYRVWLPPANAYGADDQRDETGKVVIPGNSVLVFDITMHEFQAMPAGMPGQQPGM
jgi:FKBP-type peptidyl-prolyl cis-trans isomerase FkpA